MASKYDFGGWATRNDLRCSDGRTIRKNAFKDNDGKTVPLVWQHSHNDPENVLGHALLENRDEGVYTYGVFNDTPKGQHAKLLVEHGDINALSIYANQLKQNGGDVLHGSIKEVSLVLAGANPGAYIESLFIEHSDEIIEDEAVIFTGEEFDEFGHADVEEKIEEPEVKAEVPEKQDEIAEDKPKEETPMAEGKTVQDVINTMTDEQKAVMYGLVDEALNSGDNVAAHDDFNEEENNMKHNVFEQDELANGKALSHADIDAIFAEASKTGSLKATVLAHAADYGVDPIDWLFPEAKNYTQRPEFIQRDRGWVGVVMNGVHKTPFSRVKTMFADITEDDARAKGYMKGNRKKEEVFTLLKRETSPTTIYKKQKMDRDDIIDITSFDVVAWIKQEMRWQLDEEIARAIIVGDGRSSASDDKISELNIRPIWTDDDLFTIKAVVNTSGLSTDSAKAKAFIKACIKARKEYKGSGNPVLFTTEDMLTDMLLIEDGIGHDLYADEAQLCKKLRVSKIVTVEVMEGLRRTVGTEIRNLGGIIVNLNDYNVGADKGGAIELFDDFDIDYNQFKYLIETRCSGALVKPYSAIVVELTTAAKLTVGPTAGTTTVLGKTVSSVQEGILMNDHSIEGTLKYVSNWTQYSQDPTENSGNFLVLDFDAPSDAVTSIQVLGKGTPAQTLDSDMRAVIRITSKRQKLKVVMDSATCGSTTKIYEFNGLTLEEA